MKKIFSILVLLVVKISFTQVKDLKFYLTSDSSKYVKMTYLNQVWFRYNQNNPGTLINGHNVANFSDVGLRRTRIQFFGNLHKNVFFYFQIGQNNFSFNSSRKLGFFIHDAVNEIKVCNEKLSMGVGLTGWNGLARFSSPSVGSILSMDAPLYQQTTNDVNDQFVRKFSLYAKGKIAKLDYRIIVSRPMDILKGSTSSAVLDTTYSFSPQVNSLQNHGYFMYSFFDKESNQSPYMTGAYLGSKKIVNVGFGYLFQQNALWRKSYSGMDTSFTNMFCLNGDVFVDFPLNKQKKNTVTFYGAYTYGSFGKGYYRNVGPMNNSTSVNSLGTLNGPGSAVPLIGSGNTMYFQLAYLFKKDLLPTKLGTLQPYVVYQENQFSGLSETARIYNIGVNWLIDGHRSKLSLDVQNRPVYSKGNFDNRVVVDRKNCIVLQYQINL